VALSALGMFLLVYGIQQAPGAGWGPLIGPVTVPFVIAGGLVVLSAFVLWQRINTSEVLVPLSLFKDRNFTLAAIAMTTVGFGVTSMAFPIMLWAQTVLGCSPTQAALLLAPMAMLSGVLAPFVGRLVDHGDPRILAGIGLGSFSIALFWLGSILDKDTSLWAVIPPVLLLGVANGFMWSSISSPATRNLPLHHAGAGSGVYNTVRQVGAVLGSAEISAAMESRLAANLCSSCGSTGAEAGAGATGQMSAEMPDALASGFAHAMGQSLWVPAGLVIVGFIAVLFFERPKPRVHSCAVRARVSGAVGAAWVRVAVLVDEIAVIPVDVDADLIARHMSESVDGQPGTTVDGEFAAERRSHRHRDGSGLLVFVSDLRAAAGWRFLALRRGGLSGVVAEVPVESLRGDFDRHRIGQQGHVDVADFGVGPEGGWFADDGPVLRPGVDRRCRDVEALELGFRDPGRWCRPSRSSAAPASSVAGAGIAHAEVADFFITAF